MTMHASRPRHNPGNISPHRVRTALLSIARNAASSCGIRAAAHNPQAASLASTTFDVQLKQGDVTNQKRSGRCWMFASLNTMRYRIIKNSASRPLNFRRHIPSSGINTSVPTGSSKTLSPPPIKTLPAARCLSC
mgnify:CR=1 FL=1